MCACALPFQLCSNFFDAMDCCPPGSSVHGVLQPRIQKWVAIPIFRGSSQTRDQTQVSCASCIAGGFFTTELLGKPVSDNIYSNSRSKFHPLPLSDVVAIAGVCVFIHLFGDLTNFSIYFPCHVHLLMLFVSFT